MNINLVSGGVDSSVMAMKYKDALNVYVDYGQYYAEEECNALDRMEIPYQKIKITPHIFKSKDIFVEARNLFLATVATVLYRPDIIRMAGLRDDNVVDKTEYAYDEMSRILSYQAQREIKVVSPFFGHSKGEIIGMIDKTERERLKETFSCYAKSGRVPCGDCPACLRRVVALETNGIKTGIQLTDRIIREYLRKIHRYDQDRISRLFLYLTKHGGVTAVDMDGTLCTEEPIQDRAKAVKLRNIPEVGDSSWKIVYTARLEQDREETEKWLSKHEIDYDALIMNKLPYSVLFDDLARKL